MTCHVKVLKSTSASWESLAQEAADFASNIGPERLINISVSAAGGQDFGGGGAEGCIFVWYWANGE